MKKALAHADPLRDMSESELLLKSMANYVGWEVAGALASVRLAALTPSSKDGRYELTSGIRQLEGLSECLAMVMTDPHEPARVDQSIMQVCRSLVDWRLMAGQRLRLRIQPIVCSGSMAQLLCLLTVDLVSNSLRTGLEGGGTKLEVRLEHHGSEVSLTVLDDGPKRLLAPPIGPTDNKPLLAALIQRCRGRVHFHADDSGTATIVTLPFLLEDAEGTS